MQYYFFTVPALDPEETQQTLNAFLSSHAVVSLERHFVTDGTNSFWSISVGVAAPSKLVPATKSPSKRGVDYRDVLSPAHFAIFARLRSLRNKLAEDKNSPAYAIFTNEQLAAMAQLTDYSLQSLAQIEGIGEKRLKDYAAAFLAELKQTPGAGHGQDPHN